MALDPSSVIAAFGDMDFLGYYISTNWHAYELGRAHDFKVNMKTEFKNYQINDDKNQIQLDVVHAMLRDAYWCKGIPKKIVAAAIESSLCFGVYTSGLQVGFARVVTDGVTFAWLCDVIIDERHRGQGLSKELLKYILRHSKLQGLRRICLATKDAHKLYVQFGFSVTEMPQNWMEIKDEGIYLRGNVE